MDVWCLGSGSRGNAIGVRHRDTTILVDAGFGPRSLKARADAVGFPLADVAAVVLTHEHRDHAGGAAKFAVQQGVPVYGTRGTLRALETELATAETIPLNTGSRFSIGCVTLDTCAIPHDAREPIALAVNDPVGSRVAVAYDVGHITDRLVRFLSNASAVVLEANHDVHMLRNGPYPASVRARIAGPRGHLSNATAGALLTRIHHPGLEWAMLAHVSRHCNRRDVALKVVRAVATSIGFRGALLAAKQSQPTTVLPVGRPTQLDLSLGA
jgi:phosphoribosyl 1,2-cyclic phosphodiesterase